LERDKSLPCRAFFQFCFVRLRGSFLPSLPLGTSFDQGDAFACLLRSSSAIFGKKRWWIFFFLASFAESQTPEACGGALFLLEPEDIRASCFLSLIEDITLSFFSFFFPSKLATYRCWWRWLTRSLYGRVEGKKKLVCRAG